MCLFWTIQKKRNKLVFEDEVFSLGRMNFSFVCTLCSWPRLVVVPEFFIVRKLVPRLDVSLGDW